MTATERKIIKKLIKDILAEGHAINVWDGEAYVLPEPSQDEKTVLAALGATDEDLLVVYASAGYDLEVGDIRLIYGNDSTDVIADYSTSLEHLLAGAEALAETLE